MTQWIACSERMPPMDGSQVILYGLLAGEINGIDSKPYTQIGYYSGDGDYSGFPWVQSGGDAYAVWGKPTHWLALPEPPT